MAWSHPSAFVSTNLIARLLLFIALGCGVQAAVPSYDSARAFGFQLQKEYSERCVPALLERLDSPLMRIRLHVPMTPDPNDTKAEQAQWEKIFWPMVTREIAALAPLKSAFLEHIGLIDGERVILFFLLDEKSTTFHAMKLWIEERADGKIVVTDLAMLGETLELTRRLRHTMLLLGASFSSARDDEERGLSFFSDEYRGRVLYVLQNMGRGQLDDAFKIWDQFPADLKATRLWRTTRDTLAYSGCVAARQSWSADYQAGRSTSPLLDLATARRTKNAEKTLAAFDRLVAWSFDSPRIRSEKAAYLIEIGRAGEAIALTQDIYRFNPYTAEAYSIAVHAAVVAKHPREAIAALRQWSLIVPAATIDEFLRDQPFAAELRSSPAYAEWKNSARPPGATSVKDSPSL